MKHTKIKFLLTFIILQTLCGGIVKSTLQAAESATLDVNDEWSGVRIELVPSLKLSDEFLKNQIEKTLDSLRLDRDIQKILEVLPDRIKRVVAIYQKEMAVGEPEKVINGWRMFSAKMFVLVMFHYWNSLVGVPIAEQNEKIEEALLFWSEEVNVAIDSLFNCIELQGVQQPPVFVFNEKFHIFEFTELLYKIAEKGSCSQNSVWLEDFITLLKQHSNTLYQNKSRVLEVQDKITNDLSATAPVGQAKKVVPVFSKKLVNGVDVLQNPDFDCVSFVLLKLQDTLASSIKQSGKSISQIVMQEECEDELFLQEQFHKIIEEAVNDQEIKRLFNQLPSACQRIIEVLRLKFKEQNILVSDKTNLNAKIERRKIYFEKLLILLANKYCQKKGLIGGLISKDDLFEIISLYNRIESMLNNFFYSINGGSIKFPIDKTFDFVFYCEMSYQALKDVVLDITKKDLFFKDFCLKVEKKLHEDNHFLRFHFKKLDQAKDLFKTYKKHFSNEPRALVCAALTSVLKQSEFGSESGIRRETIASNCSLVSEFNKAVCLKILELKNELLNPVTFLRLKPFKISRIEELEPFPLANLFRDGKSMEYTSKELATLIFKSFQNLDKDLLNNLWKSKEYELDSQLNIPKQRIDLDENFFIVAINNIRAMYCINLLHVYFPLIQEDFFSTNNSDWQLFLTLLQDAFENNKFDFVFKPSVQARNKSWKSLCYDIGKSLVGMRLLSLHQKQEKEYLNLIREGFIEYEAIQAICKNEKKIVQEKELEQKIKEKSLPLLTEVETSMKKTFEEWKEFYSTEEFAQASQKLKEYQNEYDDFLKEKKLLELKAFKTLKNNKQLEAKMLNKHSKFLVNSETRYGKFLQKIARFKGQEHNLLLQKLVDDQIKEEELDRTEIGQERNKSLTCLYRQMKATEIKTNNEKAQAEAERTREIERTKEKQLVDASIAKEKHLWQLIACITINMPKTLSNLQISRIQFLDEHKKMVQKEFDCSTAKIFAKFFTMEKDGRDSIYSENVNVEKFRAMMPILQLQEKLFEEYVEKKQKLLDLTVKNQNKFHENEEYKIIFKKEQNIEEKSRIKILKEESLSFVSILTLVLKNMPALRGVILNQEYLERKEIIENTDSERNEIIENTYRNKKIVEEQKQTRREQPAKSWHYRNDPYSSIY